MSDLRDLIRNALTGVPLPGDRPPPPETPEWERLAGEIIDARAAQAGPDPLLEGLDPIAFGAERRVRDGWLG